MHNSVLRHEYQEQSKRINNGFETLWVNGKKKKKKKTLERVSSERARCVRQCLQL
jgi:hypothetical protein